jgi:hypothetical protein
MNTRDRGLDVSLHTEEYMCEREDQAKGQGLKVKYLPDNKVSITDTLSGEGGVFDKHKFLCADDPLKFFHDNF